MSSPKIGVVVSSVREGRFADKVMAWLRPILIQRDDMEFEILDLADFPMPFYDDPVPTVMGEPAQDETARKWREKLAGLDGFVFVAAEYSHGPTAALKNAIDWAYYEWVKKPVAFVAYGGVGGARSVEQLRANAIEVQMAPIRHAVHIGGSEFQACAFGDGSLGDYPYLVDGANEMLDNLAWWTKALKTARDSA